MRVLPCLLLSLSPLAVRALPAPDGLDALTAYAGSWRSEIHHLPTPYSKAGNARTRLDNRCWRARAFLACEQVVDGKPVTLVVYLQGPGPGQYVTHELPADGGAARDGTLRIVGKRWIFPWRFDDHGRPVQARVVNVFHGRDAIEYRQEYSLDGVHWTVMATGRETRVR